MKMKDKSIEQYINKLVGTGVFDSIGDGISIQDTDFKILYQNSKHKLFVGEHIGEYCYKAYEKRSHICEGCPLVMTFEDGLPHTEERTAPTDRGISHFEITASTLRDKTGKIIAGIEVAREITERKRMEEKLRAAAITDDLTGLLNRRGFFTLADQQCKLATRKKRTMALVYIDVDGLKRINDELGHEAGDQALEDTAKIFKKTFRESDVIARIGGDEFAVLLTELSDPSAVNIIINHLQENIKKQNEQATRNYELSVTTGIALYDPEHSCSIDKLLNQADKSMYENKKKSII